MKRAVLLALSTLTMAGCCTCPPPQPQRVELLPQQEPLFQSQEARDYFVMHNAPRQWTRLPDGRWYDGCNYWTDLGSGAWGSTAMACIGAGAYHVPAAGVK